MTKYKIRNLKVFKTNIWTFYQDGKEKIPSEYQPDYLNFSCQFLVATYNILNFSTKKESVIILKMANIWRKNVAIFHDV